MYYIYKFLDKEQNDLYVGITNDIKRRITQEHFTNRGHLGYSCYTEVEYVVYSKCYSKDDARIKERYLINKLNPKYNIIHKNYSMFNFEINDFQWIYMPFDKEKFLKSIEKAKEKELNSLKLLPEIDIPNNYVYVYGDRKLDGHKIFRATSETWKTTIVFKGKFELNALYVNDKLFFIFYNVECICEQDFVKIISGVKLVNLMSKKLIKPSEILIIEDKWFIEKYIRPHEYCLKQYPDRAYLIMGSALKSVVEELAHSYYWKSKEVTLFKNWIDRNFEK